MATAETIRLLTVRTRAEGADSFTSAMARVNAVYVGTATAAGAAGAATDTSARKALSATRSWNGLQARVDPVAAAFQKAAREISVADRALDQGVISAARYGQEIERIKRTVESGAIGPKVDQSGINAILGIRDAAQTAARDSAQAFEREWDRLDDIARQKASQASLAFRDAFNRSMGIGGPSAASSGATFSALEDQAREQDRMAASAAALRAQLDPLGAAQGRLNAQIAEYRALAAAGEISTTQLAAAVGMAETKFDTAAAAVGRLAQAQAAAAAQHRSGGWDRLGAIGGANLQSIDQRAASEAANAAASRMLTSLGTGAPRAAAGVKLAAGEIQNMSYQLNDIAISLASGQSPFTVIMQQGAQMAQIFGPGVGVRAALAAVGSSIVTFLSNPLTLAVGAFAAAAGAATLLFSSTGQGVKSVEDILRGHVELIGQIRTKYGEAARGLQEYVGLSDKALQSDAQEKLRQLQEQLQKGTRELLSSTTFADAFSGASRFDPFADQIATLVEQARNGKPDVEAFRDAVMSIRNATSDTRVKVLANELLALTADLSQVARAVPAAEQNLNRMNMTVSAGVPILQSYGAAMRNLIGMVPELAKQQRIVDGLGKAKLEFDAAMATAMGGDGVMSDSREIALATRAKDVYQQARDAITGLTDAREKATKSTEDYVRASQIGAMNPRDQAIARENDAYRERVKLLDEGKVAQTEYAKVEAAHQANLATIGKSYGDDGRKIRQGGRKSDSEREFERARERIRDVEAEIATFGQAESAIEAYRMEQEMLAAAQRDGGTVSASQRESIRQLAQAYGDLKQRAAEMRVEQDLAIDRADVFRSSLEKNIAAMQLSAGASPTSAYGQYIDETMRLTDSLKTMGDAGREAFKGIATDLRAGMKPAEAFGNALSKIGDRIFDQAIDSAWDGIWGAFGQASGLAGLGGMGGKRDGSSASSALFVQLAASGGLGLLGSGGPFVANDNASPAFTGLTSGLEKSGQSLFASSQTMAAQAQGFTGGFGGALSSLVNGAMSIGSGFIGGFGSVLQSILGGIGGGGFSDLLGTMTGFNPFGFAAGGYTGSGRDGEPAGIVHKNEFVIPPAMVRAMGGPANVEAMLTRSPPNREIAGLVSAARQQAAPASAAVAPLTINAPVTIGANAGVSRADVDALLAKRNEELLNSLHRDSRFGAAVTSVNRSNATRRIA